ncbi:MAG: NAD(P)H-quinone dehydrogenase [Mycobacteriales bacterium]
MPSIAIVGGGPAGYEAALVAVQLGADVTLVDRDGLGGACVLTDCVPSKTLIATSEVLTTLEGAPALGVGTAGDGLAEVAPVDTPRVFARVKALAKAQSLDIAARLVKEGVQVLQGEAHFLEPTHLEVHNDDGEEGLRADVVLVATGAIPRVLSGAEPDGERILTWREIYELPALPEHLIVVGSGVTGAEFASAFRALGAAVTLVSSRHRVLPGEDSDAAEVIEGVFARRGIEVAEESRALAVRNTGDAVQVELADGRVIEGSHCLMAVGSVPQTRGLGLAEAGLRLDPHGFVKVDRVSRTSAAGVYAAGDCTGVLMLASVAAMQGRIAMWHALGEAVSPLALDTVSATVFTDPEIATVGISQAQDLAGTVSAHSRTLPLATNARAKMQGITDGFVKLFCRPGSGTVLGGVVVAPRASELILAVSLAVQNHLTVDQLAHTFAIYPSLSGSLTETARVLMPKLEADGSSK